MVSFWGGGGDGTETGGDPFLSSHVVVGEIQIFLRIAGPTPPSVLCHVGLS